MNLQLAFVRIRGSWLVWRKVREKHQRNISGGKNCERPEVKKAWILKAGLIPTRIILRIHDLKIFIISRQKIMRIIFIALTHTQYALHLRSRPNFHRVLRAGSISSHSRYFLFPHFPSRKLYRDKFLTQPCSASVCTIFILLLILFGVITFGWYDARDTNIEMLRMPYLNETTIN